MRNANRMVALIACVLCGALPASAQRGTGSGTAGGLLTPRISYDYQFADSGTGLRRRSWIRSIVLWRGQMETGNWKPADSAAATAAYRTWRMYQRVAEDSGWKLLQNIRGGVISVAQLRGNGTRLHILGQSYAVPERDSMLVVMVDRADSVGGPPHVVGVSYVRAVLPDEFWPRTWTHGDTLFTVHPHNRSELLTAALGTSPAVAAFIR